MSQYFSVGLTEAEHHYHQAEHLSFRMSSLILQLDGTHGYVPGLLDDVVSQLHFLFDEEEILMIRTLYPDYVTQHLAHGCFLRKMKTLQQAGDCFSCLGQKAAGWLQTHEEISGSFFRMYLKNRFAEREHPYAGFFPDRMILPAKRT